MKTLLVRFLDGGNYSGKSYSYGVDDSTVVAVGDYAIAHNGHDYRVVQIADIKSGLAPTVTKTLVCILGSAEFAEYEQRNVKLKQQAALFNRLEQLLAQENENNKYRSLAAHNSEAAQILTTLGLN